MKQLRPLHEQTLEQEIAIVEIVLQQAVRKALWTHHRLGVPIAIEREGKIIQIPAEKIPEEFGESAVDFAP